MPLLKLIVGVLLLVAIIGAAFDVLGPVAAVPVGLGIGWAVWRLRHPPDEPVPETRIRITFPDADDPS